MPLLLSSCKDYTAFDHTAILIDEKTKLSFVGLSKSVLNDAERFFNDKINHIYRQQYEGKTLSIVKIDSSREEYKTLEAARKAGFSINRFLNSLKAKEAAVYSVVRKPKITLAFIEGVALSNYEFLKYKTKDKNEKPLRTLYVDARSADKKDLNKIQIIAEANFFSRTLVNEPLSYLTATQLSKEIAQAGKRYGFSVQVFDKKKIEALKMGGLLAVNRGSIDPPTFTILEYKPSRKKNKKPIVLVGKGIVYDTGGLSLKPTTNS